MIDLRELRKDPEAFRRRLRGKRFDAQGFDRFVKLDGEYRELLTVTEGLRALRKQVSEVMAKTKGQGKAE